MPTPSRSPRPLPTSPFAAARAAATAAVRTLPVGALVCHERHGLGTVVALQGSDAVIVDFREGNRRRVLLNSPKLEGL